MSALTRFNPLDHWRSAGTGLAPAASLVAVAGCGGVVSNASRTSSATTASTAKVAGLTIKSGSIAKLGAVLVNSQGHTLYTLTSEASGAITCTTASGCTKYGPEIDVAAGHSARAQAPAEASPLGTEKGASGGPLVTHHGLPLYAFSGDTAPGQAKGEGLTSSGGTRAAVSTAGILVKPAAVAPVLTATPSSSGYSY